VNLKLRHAVPDPHGGSDALTDPEDVDYLSAPDYLEPKNFTG
jgi:hypothetical protein